MSEHKTLKMRLVPVYMPPSFHDDVKKAAAAERVSVSEYMRIAVARMSVDGVRIGNLG